MALDLYSKGTTDNLLAAKLDLAGGTMTGGLTLSASGIIFSDSTYLTTAPTGSSPAADQLTAGVVTANPTAGPTASGDVLKYDGTGLVWGSAGSGLPAGGVAGDALLKVDATDYNVTWGVPPLASHAETTQATVRNNTGSALLPGQIVYINGALGNRPTVALAQANSEATSAGTYAMVEAPIPDNTDGVVITSGTVMNLDTLAYTDGDKLYLSPTTAGAFTTTKPSAPDHMVYIGTVTRQHPTLGTIQLRIQNGFEITEMSDVSITSPADADLLAYDSATSLWKNESASALGLLTTVTAGTIFAPIYSPTFTGTVTLPFGSIIPGYATTSSLSAYAALTGATFSGLVSTVAATTSTAGLRVPHGAAPTTPTNGDIWTTTANVFARINGVTQTLVPTTGATFTGKVILPASTTALVPLNVPPGSFPTSPANGDIYGTNTGVFARVNGNTAMLSACRAYVLITITAGAPSVTSNHNVSSIADNGVGDFSLNFTAALPDTSYLTVATPTSAGFANTSVIQSTTTARTASLVRIQCAQTAAAFDPASISVAVFR